MKIQANALRPGHIIEHDGRQWSVLKTELLLPGKGNAFVQVEMRDVALGNKANERFRTSETVEKLMVEEKECTFLYADGEQLVFMDGETYEQFSLPAETVGAPGRFLQEGMAATAELIEGVATGVRPPAQATVTVVEADPVVKGQTASSSYKPATIDNGLRVMVPPHVEAGMRIVVSTGTASYVERAKD